MSNFNQKTFAPPIDKLRKDIGKFQEKVDAKAHRGVYYYIIVDNK